jgi:hypothetical protein
MQQNDVAAACLFNHLVGAAEQSDWESEAERFGGLEVEGQLNFCHTLHRQVGRPFGWGARSGFAHWTSGVGAALRSTPRTSAWPARTDAYYCLSSVSDAR